MLRIHRPTFPKRQKLPLTRELAAQLPEGEKTSPSCSLAFIVTPHTTAIPPSLLHKGGSYSTPCSRYEFQRVARENHGGSKPPPYKYLKVPAPPVAAGLEQPPKAPLCKGSWHGVPEGLLYPVASPSPASAPTDTSNPSGAASPHHLPCAQGRLVPCPMSTAATEATQPAWLSLWESCRR